MVLSIQLLEAISLACTCTLLILLIVFCSATTMISPSLPQIYAGTFIWQLSLPKKLF